MAKGEVVVTAQQIKNRKKFEKIVTISLLSIVLVLIIAYFVLNIIYNEGSFTISMDKNTYLKSNLVMYESMNDRSSVRKLTASNLEFMDNISIKWLPENINNEAEGSHNGENYIAYTFYLENQGDSNINYWYSIVVDDVIKNVDDAVRIMIYRNDESVVYAKMNANTEQPEVGTEAFRSDDDGTIILEKRSDMLPEEIDKITIVIWLEGDDPECVNAILGGEMKIHMDITEEHVGEENV
ncbi:MAG: hypothetical protein IJ475_00290 [Bacilli bacterium]|nr:hypothetical protein [Bacilli bacterium]